MNNKWNASGISLILHLMLSLYINAVIASFTGEPFFDVWDAMSIGIVAVVAMGLFTVGRFNTKKC